MTTMPDVITAPQAERHNRRRKGYPLPGSYWDRVQRLMLNLYKSSAARGNRN